MVAAAVRAASPLDVDPPTQMWYVTIPITSVRKHHQAAVVPPVIPQNDEEQVRPPRPPCSTSLLAVLRLVPARLRVLVIDTMQTAGCVCCPLLPMCHRAPGLSSPAAAV
jgi:hypothetical protein